MYHYSLDDFGDKIDSLYRLVILGARRANQIQKPEARVLLGGRGRKPTVVALDEIKSGKVSYRTGNDNDEDLLGVE